MVLDSWNEVPLEVSATSSVAEVKRSALARARVRGAAGDFVLKYQGAELFEDGGSITDAGVGPNAALIVLRRRRTPVR
jgi:hypothetical protein